MKRILAFALLLTMIASPVVLAAPQTCFSMPFSPGLSAAAMACCASEACGDCRMQKTAKASMAAEALTAGVDVFQLFALTSKTAAFLPDRSDVFHETNEKQAPDDSQNLYDLYSDYRI